MGFILRQLEKTYKNTTFIRRDDKGMLFYFDIKDFPGLSREEFCFFTKKGHNLKGYFYFYKDPTPNRLIVFDHGMGVGHRAYMKEIEMLAREGYLVYAYDHTGCTESEGEHIMGLSGSLADLDACIIAMKEKGFSSESISVVGHSWGAFSTLNILHFHPDLRSIVALSGFISISDMLDQVIPGIVGFSKKSLYRLEGDVNPDYYDRSARDTLAHTDKLALIIHSEDDDSVSYKRHFMKLRNSLTDKNNITFLGLKGKRHNPTYTDEAVKRKSEFFKVYSKRIKSKNIDMDKHKAFLDSYDWHRITEQDNKIWQVIFDFLKK